MNSVNSDFKRCWFTFFTDTGFHFFLSLLNHFFNSGRMNTSIQNQFFQSNSGNFTTDRIKCGKYNCLRCIINNQIHTCQRFQSTDISPFTADNPSLHLIVRKLDNRNRRFSHMIGSTFLDCCNNIILRFLSGFLTCSAFQLLNHFCSVMFYIIFNSF